MGKRTNTAVGKVPQGEGGESRIGNTTRSRLRRKSSLVDTFEVLNDAAAAELMRLWPAEGQPLTPDGVHAIRVAIRRLRSGLRQFRTKETSNAIRARDVQLRALAMALAPVRELDVLRRLILELRHDGLADRSVEMLDLALENARQRHAETAARQLNETEARALFSALADTAEAHRRMIDASQSAITVTRHAPRQLQRAFKRLAKRCHDFDRLGLEELHEARKALKTLRYTFELYQRLYPSKQAAATALRLKAMQEAFGALNDLTLTHHLQDAAEVDGALGFAAGYYAGALHARIPEVRQAAETAWDKLRRAPLVENRFRLD